MKQQHFFSFSLLLFFFLHSTTTLAQPVAAPASPVLPSPPAPPALVPSPPAPPALVPAPPASAPAPAGPTNVTKILEKASGFSLFIRLLKATSTIDQITHQLNDSNNGMTIFAPSDNAFTSLSSGTLNGLNDQQKAALIQFHVIPSYIPISQFQTVSNPLRTNAGDNSRYKYPLNVISYSTSSVNISTGITNSSVTGTVYSDGQLAVYQVDKVLLPYDLFGVKPPAPAPSPSKPNKKSKSGDSDDDSTTPDDAKVDTSAAVSTVSAMAMQNVVVFIVATASAMFCL
ncbi:hypothetical protein LWI29_032955 [Acer saccharum]|uniref:FAS1 domain-containing protein n=1 Tax=Acer saccharum TaxID=4024 RepID=A0AA39W7I0_ACESA|nr:hypothetical protein LWI29_032955 [Acer saccharum]